MSEAKIVIIIGVIAVWFIASVFGIIFVVVPKEKIASQWADAGIGEFRHKINDCYDSGGSAYVADDNKVFCSPAKSKSGDK